MKKFISLIFLPFALIACEGNYPDIKKEDTQFLKRAGENVMFLIGEPASVVDSVMQSAGVEETNIVHSPLPGDTMFLYRYNAPEGGFWTYFGGSTDNDFSCFNQRMISRKIYIDIWVSYDENHKCDNIEALSHLSNDIPHAGAYYLALSRSLYKKFSSLDSEFQWYGHIGGPYSPIDTAKGKDYDEKSRRSYESVVNKNTKEGFHESGVGNVVKEDGSQVRLVYNIGWANYDKTPEDRRKVGVEPYIEGFFDIGIY